MSFDDNQILFCPILNFAEKTIVGLVYRLTVSFETHKNDDITTTE